jgi:Mrp family chromosome partitioning ATPase
MGRMLDALTQAVGEGERLAEEAPSQTPQLQLIAEDEEDEGMPFIEVGERGKAVEAPHRAPAAPSLQPQPPRPVALAEPAARAVAFQSCWTPALATPAVARDVVAFHQADHPVSRQYRALLAQVAPPHAEGAARVLLFTSLTPAAGVTTTLLNLAVTAAAVEGREVVAVEVNLRRPALSERLGLSAGPGLQEVLAGSAALEAALRSTPQQRLQVIAAGRAGPRSGALTVDALRWLTAWLQQRFDLIFLDGPSWEERPEAAALVAAAESVLLVLEETEASRPEVQAAARAIARLGGRLGGLLVRQ